MEGVRKDHIDPGDAQWYGVNYTCLLDVQFGCAFSVKSVFDVIFSVKNLKTDQKQT
jgi:hypothetical protein